MDTPDLDHTEAAYGASRPATEYIDPHLNIPAYLTQDAPSRPSEQTGGVLDAEEPNELHQLIIKMRELCTEANLLREERDAAEKAARSANEEAVRLRAFREGTYASNISHSGDHTRSKLKPSDLPKFYGKDTEDVDDWIEKVSAITTYSNAKDPELLKLLPLLLNGNASEWFTTLGDEGRRRLNTWDAWKAALRNAFYLPDQEMRKRMMCRNRVLKRNETFGDYFQARRALQRYLYPEGTPDKILIQDIMEGIPIHLHPIIRANSIEVRTIDQFRRVLIDLEPGIRDVRTNTPAVPRAAVSNGPRLAPVNLINTTHGRKPSRTSNGGSPQARNGLPKTPCRCGAMHWYADCPLQRRKADVNLVRKASPATYPNNTPPAPGRSWRPWKGSQPLAIKSDSLGVKEINTIQTRSRRKAPNGVIGTPPLGLPQVTPSTASRPVPISEKGMDICPTYTVARMGDSTERKHRVCIDTGASISCIDHDYLKKAFPFHGNQECVESATLGSRS